jgi:hypothetical protein
VKLRTAVLLGLGVLVTVRVARRTLPTAIAVTRTLRDGDHYDDVLADADREDAEREFFAEWSKAASEAKSYSHGYVPSERAVADGDPTS